MKTKRHLTSVMLTLVVTGMCLPVLAGAQENPRTQANYSNVAEAQQAASMAKQDASSTDPALQAALADLNEAEAQMGKVKKSDNHRQMMSSKAALDNAEHQYAGMLSKVSGVSEKEIGDMHAAGISWSDVATELGVQARSGKMDHDGQKKTGSGHLADADAKGETHQGKVGSGHLADADAKGETHQGKVGSGQVNSGVTGSMMGSKADDIAEATARNPGLGKDQGHLAGMQTAMHDSGEAGKMSGAVGLSSGMGSGGSSSGGHGKDGVDGKDVGGKDSVGHGKDGVGGKDGGSDSGHGSDGGGSGSSGSSGGHGSDGSGSGGSGSGGSGSGGSGGDGGGHGGDGGGSGGGSGGSGGGDGGGGGHH